MRIDSQKWESEVKSCEVEVIPFEAEAESATVCHELAFVDGDSNCFGIVDWLLRPAPAGGRVEWGKEWKGGRSGKGEEVEWG